MFYQVYNESVDNQTSHRVEKDTFLSLYEYSHHIEDKFMYFQEMGVVIVEPWKKSAPLNDQRVDGISEAFIDYVRWCRSTEACEASNSVLVDIRSRGVTHAMPHAISILIEEEYVWLAVSSESSRQDMM